MKKALPRPSAAQCAKFYCAALVVLTILFLFLGTLVWGAECSSASAVNQCATSPTYPYVNVCVAGRCNCTSADVYHIFRCDDSNDAIAAWGWAQIGLFTIVAIDLISMCLGCCAISEFKFSAARKIDDAARAYEDGLEPNDGRFAPVRRAIDAALRESTAMCLDVKST